MKCTSAFDQNHVDHISELYGQGCSCPGENVYLASQTVRGPIVRELDARPYRFQDERIRRGPARAQPGPGPAPFSGKERPMHVSRCFVATMLLLSLALVGTAGDDKAKKLVGVWEVSKSKDAPPGATIEFTADAKMKLRANIDGKEFKADGTYEL